MAKGRKGTPRRGGSPSSLIQPAATEDSFSSSTSSRAPQRQSAERKRKEQGEKLKIQSTTAEGRPSMLDQSVKMASKKGKSLQLLCRGGDCKEVPTAKKRRAHRMTQMQQVPQSPDTHKSSGESVDQEPPPIGRNPLRQSITKEHLMEALRQANEELQDSRAMYDRENAFLDQAFEDLLDQYNELWKMYLMQKDDIERLLGLVRQLCLRFASYSGDPKFVPPPFPSDDGSGAGSSNSESDSDE